jgi:CPA1 family monovalent cation:H+ antiporter
MRGASHACQSLRKPLYAAYLAAEGLHASGVLAVVTYGLYVGRWENNVSARVRMEGTTVWRHVILAVVGSPFLFEDEARGLGSSWWCGRTTHPLRSRRASSRSSSHRSAY